jgi:hypothetical protein
MDFSDESEHVFKTDPLYLGVLGYNSDATEEKVREQLLQPMLQELGRMPDKMILPTEGNSSVYLVDWAEQMKVETQVYEPDWRRHQKRAKIYRDTRIQKEATHFLIFLNKRTDTNAKLADRLAKKGHTVFTVAYDTWEIEMLSSPQPLPQPPQPSSVQPAARSTKRGCTPGTGTAPKLSQSMQSKGPGIQVQLTDLWAT